MVGIVEVGGAISGLKNLLDIAKSLKAVSDEATVNEVKIALQGAVLEAQKCLMAAHEAQATNVQQIADLEKEIARLNDWSEERERYELIAVRGGGYTYMPKAGMENDQPAHWLCANCFDQGHKSIMQNKGQAKPGTGNDIIGCDRCGGSFSALPRTRPVYDRGGPK